MGHRWIVHLFFVFAISCPVAGQVSKTRGPYLQSLGTDSVTIVWQTDISAPGKLEFGRREGPPWDAEVQTPAGTTHAAVLTGLTPDSAYAYEVSAGGDTLASGPELAFRTSPPMGSVREFRFVAWGDSGVGSSVQLELMDHVDALTPRPALILGLGDLVYENGEWEKYDPVLFEPMQALLPSICFWPTPGNHDLRTDGGAPFLANFYLPTNSGAPGHPSGSELFYSFDHGLAHFVCIDWNSPDMSVGGDMYNWMVDDLQDAEARGARWKIVFCHQPPYTHGTHDSDEEGDLAALRDNFVPAMEAQGVDLVLGGHSHNYERSYLVKDDAILQTDADEYTKYGTQDGTLYIVSGCGGKSGSGSLDHPLMATSIGSTNGVSVFDVTPNALRGYFVERDGSSTDLFTLRKLPDVNGPHVVDVDAGEAHLQRLQVTFNEPVKPGSGAGGAENTNGYGFLPPVSVFGVTLLSDQRTVELTTSPLAPATAYLLDVGLVQDTSSAENVAGANARSVFLVPAAPPGIQKGALWKYFEGLSFPGAGWNQPGYDDSAWPSGEAGFGYSGGDDATELANMYNNYVTVYARKEFQVGDPASVTDLDLRISYDDGFVAFLNGAEVARNLVPTGQNASTTASGSHNAGVFERFDLNAFSGLLQAGTNVLAVEGHNNSLGSSDFSLHPFLEVDGDTGVGGFPPDAVLDVDVEVGAAPFVVNFSSTDSMDPDGAITEVLWDFGDGSPPASVATAQHMYSEPGVYHPGLVVTDGSGLQDVASVTIFAAANGSAPVATLTASTTNPSVGEAVSFSSVGSFDPEGGNLTYDWDFDDPGSGAQNRSTLAAPSHTFSQAGAFTVTLRVLDTEGLQGASQLDVSVEAGGSGGGGGGGGGGCTTAPLGRDLDSGDLSFLIALLFGGAFLAWRAQRAGLALRG